MYLQEILEVAIGLIFVWLAVSFTTMSLLEWLSNITNLRARDLEKAIAQMLASQDFTRRFYGFPLIANLYARPKKSSQKPRLPSYIPANKFSGALFELVIQAGKENSPFVAMLGEIEKQFVSIETLDRQNLARNDWEIIMEAARNVLASGLGTDALDSLKFFLQSFGEKFPELKPFLTQILPQVDKYYGQFVEEQRTVNDSGPDSGLAMRQFRLGMLALQKINPELFESIAAVFREAEVQALRGVQALSAIRVNLESWFNDAMDRLSGIYKRRAQLISFIIGLFLAILLNVDSINLATNLWREPVLRQAILVQAQHYTNQTSPKDSATSGPLENIPALENQLQALRIPLGWTMTGFSTGGKQCSLLPIKPNQVPGIPFWGVYGSYSLGQPICYAITNSPIDITGWLSKLLGILITGVAAAQGAPFWFDILKKFINIRGTGTDTLAQKPVG